MRAAFGLLCLVAVIDLKKLFQKGHGLLYPWQMLPVPRNKEANRRRSPHVSLQAWGEGTGGTLGYSYDISVKLNVLESRSARIMEM
jgi:hypothetical protein